MDMGVSANGSAVRLSITADREKAMIRQAISCDICGAEKKQTNHWFVVYAHGGELRVTGWTANSRIRAGSKHLCGQTCLHKLVDEFIAGNMSGRVQPAPEAIVKDEPLASTDASLTSKAAYAGPPIATEAPAKAGVAMRSLQMLPNTVIAIAPSRAVDEPRDHATGPPFDDPPNYTSRRWRAEAWERERERERRSSMATHRKTS
jgi:hypothetical protein